MHTLIIKKSGTTRNKVVLGILIAIVIFGIVKFSMGQVPGTTPLPCPIQTYSAMDHGTSDPVGSQSEKMALTFFQDIATLTGRRHTIDFENLPAGNFNRMPVDAYVMAELAQTGDSGPGEMEGIANSNSSDILKGFNTTPNGYQHLQVHPLTQGVSGGVTFNFFYPISAFGCYITGRELTLRPVVAVIEFPDGREEIRQLPGSPVGTGGLQFFGFTSLCSVSKVSFIQIYTNENSSERDVFGIDDIVYQTPTDWIPATDCHLIRYSNRDNGPMNGGEPNPLATGWTYPNSSAEKSRFLMDVAALGFTTDTVTFEKTNGWAAVVGLGDLFIGLSAPYPGTPTSFSSPYTISPIGLSGNLSSGDASGVTEYYSGGSRLLFNVYYNGHNAGLDEPGIGDMDGSNDTDRGINTSPGGNHFLQIMPSESHSGGFRLEFDGGTPAAGMYVQGVEDTKRRIDVVVEFSNGSRRIYPDLTRGPVNVGGIEFLGFISSSPNDRNCWIASIEFSEAFSGESAQERDIFSIDDIVYAKPKNGPPIDPAPSDCIELDDLKLGAEIQVGDPAVVNNATGSLKFNVEGQAFQWSDGTWFSGGQATVTQTHSAGNAGNEININNINLHFVSSVGGLDGISMLYGEYGGNINLEINGDFRNASNFTDLHGMLIGGVRIMVHPRPGNPELGEISLVAENNPLAHFKIGGQELYIDHLCPGSGMKHPENQGPKLRLDKNLKNLVVEAPLGASVQLLVSSNLSQWDVASTSVADDPNSSVVRIPVDLTNIEFQFYHVIIQSPN